jgi:predicted TIM-barrel fold metal-dependent hydrolase
MSDLFSEVASIDYPIIDADAHVYEPPDVWQARVPARLRERAPQVSRTDEGDVWSFDAGARVRPVGLMAAAGASYLDFRPSGLTYDTIRRGHFEPGARRVDMDADGIAVQLLYPSVCEEGARMFGDERELQLACVRAYNEWLLEFCAASPARLFGHAVIPATGVADAIAELEWALRAGYRRTDLDLPSGRSSSAPTIPSGRVEEARCRSRCTSAASTPTVRSSGAGSIPLRCCRAPPPASRARIPSRWSRG